jgi:hypothetical protein
MKTIAAKTRTGGRLDHAVSGTTTALRRSSCLWTLDQVALDLSPAGSLKKAFGRLLGSHFVATLIAFGSPRISLA